MELQLAQGPVAHAVDLQPAARGRPAGPRDRHRRGVQHQCHPLGGGTRDIVATTTGWDINPRALGIVPAEAKVQKLDGFHWVTDAHYAVIPKGVSDEKIAVLMDVLNYILQPKQQAIAYDAGYFYPGPAVKDVTIDMAPQESQDVIKEFGRPEYADWIANNPLETPLEPKQLVEAFRIWDEKIGAKKG